MHIMKIVTLYTTGSKDIRNQLLEQLTFLLNGKSNRTRGTLIRDWSRDLLRKMTKNLKSRGPVSRWKDLPEGQPPLQYSITQVIMNKMARLKLNSLIQVFVKRCVKDSYAMRKKSYYVLTNSRSPFEHYIWSKAALITQRMIPFAQSTKHSSGSIMQYGSLSAALAC